MRLSPDCIREILLVVESLDLNERLFFDELCERIPQFPQDDIQYTCVKLIEAGYLNGVTTNAMGLVTPFVTEIWDMTYLGHEFLDTIRPTTVWEKTKSAIESIGGTSLPVILDAAKDLTVSILSAKINSQL